MRLIDADDFEKTLQALIVDGAPYQGVLKLLKKQRTAYDIEKVLEQIKKQEYLCCDFCNWLYATIGISLDNLESIIRSGGLKQVVTWHRIACPEDLPDNNLCKNGRKFWVTVDMPNESLTKFRRTLHKCAYIYDDFYHGHWDLRDQEWYKSSEDEIIAWTEEENVTEPYMDDYF